MRIRYEDKVYPCPFVFISIKIIRMRIYIN